MKKLFLVLLTMIFALTMSACKGDDVLSKKDVAEIIIENFDGDLSHLSTAMDIMDFSEEMEFHVEGNIDLMIYGRMTEIQFSQTEKTMMVNGFNIHSLEQTFSYNGRTYELETIMEEVSDGVDVYFNLERFLSSLSVDIYAELIDYVDAFDINGDWLTFHFEDSIENMIEVEIMKDFLIDILKDEMGSSAYTELQSELELMLELDLNPYGVDIPEMGLLLENNNYDELQIVLEGIDFQGIEDALYDNQQTNYNDITSVASVALRYALEDLDIDIFMEELKTFDFEMLLTKVSEGETAYKLYLDNLNEYPTMKSFLEPFTSVVIELEDADLLEEIGYTADNMNVFYKFFDAEYLSEEEVLEVTAVLDEFDNVLTSVLINVDNSGELFQDAITEFYWFANDFPGSDLGYVENINCPSGEVCDSFDEYYDIPEDLANIDPLSFTFLYDAGTEQTMTMSVDCADFIESIAKLDDLSSEVREFNFEVSISDSTEIFVPVTAKDIKPAVEELVKVNLLDDFRYTLSRVYNDYTYGWGLEYGVVTKLSDYGDYSSFNSVAIDQDKSTLKIIDLGSGTTVVADLYWRDGTSIFGKEVTLSELDILINSYIYNDIDRDKVLDIVEYINDDNFSLGKALVYFVLRY